MQYAGELCDAVTVLWVFFYLLFHWNSERVTREEFESLFTPVERCARERTNKRELNLTEKLVKFDNVSRSVNMLPMNHPHFGITIDVGINVWRMNSWTEGSN